MKPTLTFPFAAALLALAALVGCNTGDGTDVAEEPNAESGDHDHHEGHEGDEHAHGAHGPHDGHLVELGGGEYHAEVVEDKPTAGVAVYILDESGMTAAPIDAQELTLNVSHDGQPQQVALAAAPRQGDPEGKSSKFTGGNSNLVELLHEEGAQARLTVNIGGTPYSGNLTHEHEHE